MTAPFDILRLAGFFKGYELLTNDEIIQTLLQKKSNEYARMFGPAYHAEVFSDLTELLEQDDKKFLTIDLEADVCAENKVYTRLLDNFSKASNGFFTPSRITETWESDEGPIRVSFTSDGREVVFAPEYFDDWIDGRIFYVINREMKRVSNEEFVVCMGPGGDWFGQNIIHIRLTKSEKELLAEKLQWEFPE